MYILKFWNNGPDFTEEDSENLDGTGIGSLMIQHLARLHRGTIKHYNDKGAVTEITMFL